MAQGMKLDILTPLGPVREGVDVGGVQVPGILGELGILPQHESFITAVVPGVVRFREGAQSVRIAVGAGFLEVKDTGRVVILVERALEPAEIDSGKARTELEEVKRELAAYSGPIGAATFRNLDTRRAWLEAQLRAAAS
jgi:F-type H+-transporting ATPase subunit epsilon